MHALLEPRVPLSIPTAAVPVSPPFGAEVAGVDLHKAFTAKLAVLRGIDLKLAPGEFVAVIGRSGSGKSTLLRLLAGLEEPSRGAVSIDGKPLRGLHPDVRVMFQDARLMSWLKVRENVGLGLKGEWRSAADEVLHEVGLLDRAGDWPSILSGGQRQRVALARALASRPRFLLLDEPLGALDALTRRGMQRLIERLWQLHGFTAMLITHDVEEALALADRVLLIENGRITLNEPVPFPRPRDRAHPGFIALRERILTRIHEEE